MFPVMSAGNPITGYNINNSLRFRSSASPYLSRTPASASSRTTWTWSGWIKRGSLGGSGSQIIMHGGTAANGNIDTLFGFTNADIFFIYSTTYGSTNDIQLNTTQVFRDVSAWYHITVVMDTTQATSSNRCKIYVNGSQVTSFSTATYPTQNYSTGINNNQIQYISNTTNAGFGSYFDGYLAETYFIDGQALTPSSFGATDATTGQWLPKAYSGIYGTNGFYLPFSSIATTSGSNAGLGKDFSGNGNYWNTNNISVTAGTTYDAMTDSPTLTSTTVANYCVLNPLQKGSAVTLSNANLTWSTSGASSKVLSTIGMSSGKYYCEFTMASGNGNYGIATAQTGLSGSNYLGDDTNSWCYATNGNKYTNGSGSAYGATYTSGDIIGIAFDADNGTLTYYKNGTSQGTAYTGLTSGPYFFAQGADPSAGSVNFGQRPFAYTPPTGYLALNTYNLPTPTIKQGNTVMDVNVWAGTGATANITTPSSFKPDFVWIKNRSSGTAYHNLYDTTRGAGVMLVSNTTDADQTLSNRLTAFTSTGYTLGSHADANASGSNYVGWEWKANGGTTSSNTNGSITSTVQANTTAGFSIVTYTGNGTAGATVGHGLGIAPKFIIVKGRSNAVNWIVYSYAAGTDQYLELNTTSAKQSQATYNMFNSTAPTSSVFTLGNLSNTNGSTVTYVAYCFAEIAGFSKFGSYTGNGSTDGTFIYTGFRPKFILVKRTSVSGSWVMYDTSRSSYNVMNNELVPDTSAAEDATSTNTTFDFLSNGIKCRNTWGSMNQSGVTYIYAAFAENPFKYSNAR